MTQDEWFGTRRQTTAAEQVTLHQSVPPPGDNISVSVDPFPVSDSIYDEEEIEWFAKCLRPNCSLGPLGILAEHLRRWMSEARKEEEDTAMGVEMGTYVETEM